MSKAQVVAVAAASVLSLAPIAARAAPGVCATKDPLLGAVDPFVGTEGGGNTVPGAGVPFGFVSLSPDTTRAETSGYDSKSLIIGFSHTHVSGTGGGGKYGNFRVTPAIGGDALGDLAFPRAEEEASPGCYSIVIGRPGKTIRAELTASRRVGLERFTFPATDQAQVVIDVSAQVPRQGGGPRTTLATVNVEDAQHVSGAVSAKGGFGAGGYTLYFAAAFDRPALRIARLQTTRGHVALTPGPGQSSGGDQRQSLANQLGAIATFDTRDRSQVEVKLAVSFISVDQAKRTLATELPGWDFEAALDASRREWRRALDRVQVQGGTAAERRIFYSALYRAHTMPHDVSGENAWWTSNEPHYEDFYTLWDTFRTVNPLLTLIEPDRERGMVRSLIDTYVHTGWLPDARIAGSTGPTQGGSNADVVLADAIVKDLGGFDRNQAFEAILKDGTVQSPDPLNYGRELKDYQALGYMALDQTRSASRTLEYAYDDFAIAEAAAKLGRWSVAARFAARSNNWAKLWDPQLRCIHPRYPDGRWLENFDCSREYPDETGEWWDPPFYEGTSGQYSTFVPHDPVGLMRRLGGPEALTAWLDGLFERGEYTQDNEPDLLAPFLYIHAGRPDRTELRVRQIMGRYKPTRRGLPGNDDAGTLSSWYVWAAMGLFPNAGQPLYYIASPVFTISRIDLGRGRSFTIEAPGTSDANLYVQSATLNGRPLDRAWLTHAEVAAGGRLVLQMGPHPSNWGRTTPPPDGLLDLDVTITRQRSAAPAGAAPRLR